jgi:hypothetical protein
MNIIACSFANIATITCVFIFPGLLYAETPKFVSHSNLDSEFIFNIEHEKISIFDSREIAPNKLNITIEKRNKQGTVYLGLYPYDGSIHHDALPVSVPGRIHLVERKFFQLGSEKINVEIELKREMLDGDFFSLTLGPLSKPESLSKPEKCIPGSGCINKRVPVHNYRRDVICTIKSLLTSPTVDCVGVVVNERDSSDPINKDTKSINVENVVSNMNKKNISIEKNGSYSQVGVSSSELFKVAFGGTIMPDGAVLYGDFYIAYGADREKFVSLLAPTPSARIIPTPRPGDVAPSPVRQTQPRSQNSFVTTRNANVRSIPDFGDNIRYTIGNNVRVVELDNNGN